MECAPKHQSVSFRHPVYTSHEVGNLISLSRQRLRLRRIIYFPSTSGLTGNPWLYSHLTVLCLCCLLSSSSFRIKYTDLSVQTPGTAGTHYAIDTDTGHRFASTEVLLGDFSQEIQDFELQWHFELNRTKIFAYFSLFPSFLRFSSSPPPFFFYCGLLNVETVPITIVSVQRPY